MIRHPIAEPLSRIMEQPSSIVEPLEHIHPDRKSRRKCVIPAEAGTHAAWVPAYAAMTRRTYSSQGLNPLSGGVQPLSRGVEPPSRIVPLDILTSSGSFRRAHIERHPA